MPDPRRRTCQVCKKTDDEVGPISHRGKCSNCAIQRLADNNIQIAVGSGPYAERRLRRTIMAAQRRLVALERDAL